MARELAVLDGVETVLSLSTGAELLGLPDAPENVLPMRTYAGRAGLVRRVLETPWTMNRLVRQIRALAPDVALCAMPAALDLVMAAALRRAGVPYAVVVHDARGHPGDHVPMQMTLQRWLTRGASTVFALSGHVAGQLRRSGLRKGQRLAVATLPPFVFGAVPPLAGAHGGKLRVLGFGRLLPYKGLDLLADALERLQGLPQAEGKVEVRVVGSGPRSAALRRLEDISIVSVENRWVPEAEIGALLGWADVLVLSHLEASQSGVAAAAVAARRWVVATRVGGITEQLRHEKMAVLCSPDGTSIAQALAGLVGRPPPLDGGVVAGWAGSAKVVVAGLQAAVRG